MVFQANRALIEKCVGVGGGKITHRHGHPTEVFAGGAVFVHIAARAEGDPGRRGHKAIGKVMAEVDDVGIQRAVIHHLAAAEAQAGAFIQRPINHYGIAQAAGNGGGGMHKWATGGSATELGAGEKLQFLTADLTQNFVFPVVVHAEAGHAVDVAAFQSGVVQCGFHRLAGQLHFAAAGILGKLGGTNADDGGFTG